jgi:hypothetical protein
MARMRRSASLSCSGLIRPDFTLRARFFRMVDRAASILSGA